MRCFLKSFWVVSILLLGLAYHGLAVEMTSPGCGCTLAIPDDWTVMGQMGITSYLAISPDRNATVSLFIAAVDSAAPLNDDSLCVKKFAQSLIDQGASITGCKRQKINGREFYIVNGIVKSSSPVERMVGYLTLANGHVFQIGINSWGSNLQNEDGKLAILDSFSIPPQQKAP